MSLTLAQRLDRVKVRIDELGFWRARQTCPISDWTFNGTPIALGEFWPGKDGVQHFAAHAAVPDGWPIEQTRLSLNVGGESLVSLDYPEGHTDQFGLDPYHEEFPLKGKNFAISTDSVPRLPFGQPVREPQLMRAELIWLDLPVHRLQLLLTQIAEAISVLEGHDVVPHLLDAAETGMRGLDWPSATHDYIARMAPSPQQQRIWQLPETTDHPEALNQGERASVASAHEALVATLQTLSKRFPPQGEIALTGHAHIDLAWLWPYAETRRKMRRTFHTALSLMDQSTDFRFNQSTAHYYAQIEADDPALFDRITQKVKSGQWETLGGMWVEPDTNMPTGESLVRQVLYGQRYFEKKFGTRHTICWLPDCFGFSGALPQILKQGGIDNFFTIKVNWNETNKIPADLFWWEGLDGSRVLTHTFDNPMQGYNGFVRPDCFVPTWKNFRGKVDHPTTLLAVGYGDGGGGVTPEMVEREVQLRDFPVLPKARWTTVRSFFDDAHKTAASQTLPVWQGEIYLELHRATLTTQSGVKRKHRQAERALITAETLASLAHMLGANKPESLEPHWHMVLKNEFHDILPGSSISEVYQDAERELDGVIDAGQTAQQKGLSTIAGQMVKGEIEDGLIVVNPTLSDRSMRVRLADGSTIATSKTIPPLGIAVIDTKAQTPVAGLNVSTTKIENAHLCATIGSDGTITSLVHKATGREALAGRGNQLWAYPVDKPRNWDAWDVETDYAERGEEITTIDKIEIVENTPHRAAVRITRHFRNSSIAQTIALAANSRRLDIETDLDWHDRRVFLRTLTPAAVRSPGASFESAYGVTRRTTHTNTSWDEAMFEAPAHRFVDLSEPGFGLALLNNAKYGHSAKGNVLGLSLLRSPIYPDPLADEGKQSFTYALMPHEGDWFDGGVREEADDLNQPLLSIAGSGLQANVVTPVSVAGIPAALSALKPAEDQDGIVLRVYEPAGRRGNFALGLENGWRATGPVSIMEEPMERGAGAELRPFEIRSWILTR
ncbi:glycoside hydrolase family 38 C-terminal domain-containing protein [Devosia rhodophyticola]|uniref:Glycoside hydrolase family 38 C-terminal domain-containing protein n=1 Tax=Devosia rhodophyticola TaxID=3026423 RepID=A0ABY7Z145_9HYPH|nr:glycoside hydrolase family 38 C-terminal domain-containing protein [Devosia rhodophyticola]WDR06940.1 glycoside hydrolase family 38 C-terminal domain-containing protein [Devosia rhodophyticola]